MIVSFDEYNKKEKELKDYKKSICEKINQFIEIDFIKTQIRQPFKGVYDFYFDKQKRGNFVIEYSYGENYRADDLEFTNKEYLRLIDFMKDTEEYKLKINTDKYNL